MQNPTVQGVIVFTTEILVIFHYCARKWFKISPNIHIFSPSETGTKGEQERNGLDYSWMSNDVAKMDIFDKIDNLDGKENGDEIFASIDTISLGIK